MSITPEKILVGLANSEKETIATLLSLYEEANLPNMMVDMARDSKNWVLGKAGFQDYQSAVKSFENRLSIRTKALLAEEVSVNSLRLRLWMHLRNSYGLAPKIALSTKGITDITKDVAVSATRSFMSILDDESVKDVSIFGSEYWKYHANRRLNPFTKEGFLVPTFEELVQQNALKMLAAAAQKGQIPKEIKEELAAKIREKVDNLDERVRRDILDELGVEQLSDEAAFKLLLGAGGLAGVGIAVEMAGFSAYILAAKASAFIPLVGGKTLVCTLSVLANPFFIIPVIMGGGVYMSGSIKRKILQNFGVAVTTILAVKALAHAESDATPMVQIFKGLPNHLPNEIIANYQEKKAEEPSLFNRFKSMGGSALEYLKDHVSSQVYPDAQGYLELYYEKQGQ